MLLQDEWLENQKAEAKANQSAGGGDKRSAQYQESVVQKIEHPVSDKNANSTNQKIAAI